MGFHNGPVNRLCKYVSNRLMLHLLTKQKKKNPTQLQRELFTKLSDSIERRMTHYSLLTASGLRCWMVVSFVMCKKKKKGFTWISVWKIPKLGYECQNSEASSVLRVRISFRCHNINPDFTWGIFNQRWVRLFKLGRNPCGSKPQLPAIKK